MGNVILVWDVRQDGPPILDHAAAVRFVGEDAKCLSCANDLVGESVRGLIIQSGAGWTQTSGDAFGQRVHYARQSAHVGPPHVAVAQRRREWWECAQHLR